MILRLLDTAEEKPISELPIYRRNVSLASVRRMACGGPPVVEGWKLRADRGQMFGFILVNAAGDCLLPDIDEKKGVRS